MSESVAVERRDLVSIITFSSPSSNFASPELVGTIADAVEAADADEGVRCMLLRSEGSVFCAGANLASAELSGSEAIDRIAALYRQAARLFARRKPMVAAVQGAAVGAGLGLALAADFRVASERAKFSANFVRLGFAPGFALTFTLPRLVGMQHASKMMLTGERVRAETASAWGLVDEVVGADELEAAAGRLAWSVAGNAPLSLTSVRRSLRADDAQEAAMAMARELEAQAALHATADYREGVAAVFERREPKFTGT